MTDTPSNDTLKAFAALLASTTDASARKKMLARAEMLAMNAAPQEAFEPPIRTLGDYLDAEIELPPVLIHPFLAVRGGLNVTVGRAGKGKTVMNLNRMLRWAAGLPWFDDWTDKDGEPLLAPSRALKILIVENEGAAGLFHRQIGLMLNAEDYMDEASRSLAKENVLVWGEGGYSGMKLDDPAKLNALRAGVEKWQPDMVFIEPFRSLWNGDENSSTDMNIVVDALVAMATDYNCAVWAAHHEKKGGHGEDDKMSAARGSTVLEGVVTVMENFESTKGGAYREMTWSKSRHSVPPTPISLEWDETAWWYKHVPSERIEDDIKECLAQMPDEPMSARALADATDYTVTKLNKALGQMVKDGVLKRMQSISDGNGSTGPRYIMASGENSGGLSV